MRRIVMFNNVSAEGHFAAADGGLDWVVDDPEFDKAVTAGGLTLDTVLFGRRTYEMFAGFWPYITKDTPDPHTGEPISEGMLEMGRALNGANKVVFSRTLQEATWANTRTVPELDRAEIEAMKRAPGPDIMIFGSGSVVSKLTECGLIDEYQLVVNPVLLGIGQPWLADVARRVPLELFEATTYPSGKHMLRYRPRRDGV
jgi:dihydrofolate reductase